MKNVFKLLLSLVIVLSLSLSILSFGTLAAGSAIISFSKSKISVGDNVTVNFVVTAPTMYGIDVSGTYDPEVLTYVSGASSNSNGGFKITDSNNFNGESRKTFSVTFTAAKAGSCPIYISGNVASGNPPVDVSVGASATMTVNEAAVSTQTASASANTNLKALSVSTGELTPKFSPSTTSYTVNVAEDVTKCDVYATAEDADAKVAISGSASLNAGKNTRNVTVTAPNGEKKVYTVIINRGNAEETAATQESPKIMQTVVDGATYIVLNDITGVALPVGFNATQKTLKGEPIAVATDEKENFVLYYLKPVEGDTPEPYTYDAKKNAFKKVQIISQGSNSYIVSELPVDLTVPDNFTSKIVKIQDMDVNGFVSLDEDLKDMYYVYCYFGGNYSMYRYDSVEHIIQRSPELKLVPVTKEAETKSAFEIVNRFNTLSSSAKTTVVCLCVTLIGIVALVILLVIKIVSKSKKEDLDLDNIDDDFDSVTFDDNYEIISNSKDKE